METRTPSRPTWIPAPGASGGSEYVLFAHLRAKDIRESAVFGEIKKAVAKEGATADWDELENKVAKEIGGIKPTDIDSVTACVTEVPERDMPKFILIVTTAKPINKAGIQACGKSHARSRRLLQGRRQRARCTSQTRRRFVVLTRT